MTSNHNIQNRGGYNTALQRRVAGLDIIRALAIVCVIGGHYFINTDFNSTPFNTPLMFGLGMLQTFTLIGVPLFLLLTGYLNINKIVPDKKYFKGIWRVIIAYVVFSILTIVFRKYYLGESRSTIKWILSIFSFQAIPYSWYIEMWIGLFLLTPFLNKLWHACDDKRHRQILIAVLFLTAALPDFTNRYGLHLLPGYWVNATYPLLCFFLGTYIRTYQPSFSGKKLGTVIICLCLINPILSNILAYGKPMLHLAGGPGGVVSIPLAVCTFLLLYKRGLVNKPLKRAVIQISIMSLNMYLAAYLSDQLLYPIWKENIGVSQAQLGLWYPAIILSLVLCNFILAWLYDKGATALKATYKAVSTPQPTA